MDDRQLALLVRDSRLVASEQLFEYETADYILVCKPDQVYETAQGHLLLLENKLRLRCVATRADQVQLSVARHVLTRGFNKSVLDVGIVRCENPVKGARHAGIALLSWTAVDWLARRQIDLDRGRRLPEAMPGRRCGHCEIDGCALRPPEYYRG